jgi:hypothetical protein
MLKSIVIMACGAAVFSSIALAQFREPTTKPAATSQPATKAIDWSLVPLVELEAQASAAFEAGRYEEALPLLKSFAVRIRHEPERVQIALEKVRVCEAILSARAANQPGVEGQNIPRVAHDSPREGETRELTLMRLGNFEYDAAKGGNIPADVKALNGLTVKMKGYMLPLDQAERITKFALVPDLFACCFGQPPQLQHIAIVRTPAGKSVAYYPEPIWVTGKLTVEEKSEDGFIVSLFEIDTTSVKPAE